MQMLFLSALTVTHDILGSLLFFSLSQFSERCEGRLLSGCHRNHYTYQYWSVLCFTTFSIRPIDKFASNRKDLYKSSFIVPSDKDILSLIAELFIVSTVSTALVQYVWCILVLMVHKWEIRLASLSD